MKKRTSKDILSLLVLGVVVIAIYFFAKSQGNPCARRISYRNIHVNNGINWDSLFAEPGPAEIQRILEDWRTRPLQPKQVEVITEYKVGSRHQMRVVRHRVGERTHFGALFLPDGYQQAAPGSLPVLILAHGLDQRRPVVDVYGGLIRQTLGALDSNFIVVVPSYRGQSLRIGDRYYCSDGFFGDAFDGATDDALALLNVCLSSVPAADENLVVTLGVSRGGTVALLAGIRDPRIQLVVDLAGPANFLSRKVHSRYFKQYKYQFLSTKAPIPELRKRILASSPYHFSEYLPDVVIAHGAKDEVVPVEQAQNIIDRLQEKGHKGALSVDVRLNGGHDFGGLEKYVERVNEWGGK
jgi:dipeptidyl aminopeptidase/acylaminoacyl peptidase